MSRLPTWRPRAVLHRLARAADLRGPSTRALFVVDERDPRRPLRRRAPVGVAALTLAATGYAVACDPVEPDPACGSG